MPCAMRSEEANLQDVKSCERVPRKRCLRSGSGRKRSGISDVAVYGTCSREVRTAGDAVHDFMQVSAAACRIFWMQCSAVLPEIGHGIALRGQKEAIQICRDRHIGIEMCPLSNMQTKAVKDPADYPVQEFLEAESSGDRSIRITGW